ncbi:hypothetical protein ACLI4Q_17340 [Natrialbaceae archaeon A-CW1-1]
MERRQVLSRIGGAGIVLGAGTNVDRSDTTITQVDAVVDRERSEFDEHLPEGVEIDLERIDGECLSDETPVYPTIRVHEDGLRIRATIEAPTPCHEVALESAVVRDRTDDGIHVGANDGNGSDEPGDELVLPITPTEPSVDACVQCIGAVHYDLALTIPDLEKRPDSVRLVHDAFDEPSTVFVLEWP